MNDASSILRQQIAAAASPSTIQLLLKLSRNVSGQQALRELVDELETFAIQHRGFGSCLPMRPVKIKLRTLYKKKEENERSQ